jgi:smad nuclear-interacting protein 1
MGSPSRYNRSSRDSLSRSRSPPQRRERYSRSRSPVRRNSRSPRRSRSPPRRRSRSPFRRNNNESQPSRGRNRKFEWGKPEDNVKEEEEPIQKIEPNFGLSGKLAAETNTVKGVELKYNEPPEAAKPKTKWRLYVFKGDEQIGIVFLNII